MAFDFIALFEFFSVDASSALTAATFLFELPGDLEHGMAYSLKHLGVGDSAVARKIHRT